MASKIEAISKAEYKDKPADINIDKAWDEAKKWLAAIGASTTSKPDTDKIRAAMAKQKKAMAFVASFDGKWLSLDAVVGSTVVDKETTQNIADADQKKWRASLELLRKNSKLVTDADLKAFDAKHPSPEEAARVRSRIDTLGREIKLLNIQLQRLQAELKPKLEELQRQQTALKALGG